MIVRNDVGAYVNIRDAVAVVVKKNLRETAKYPNNYSVEATFYSGGKILHVRLEGDCNSIDAELVQQEVGEAWARGDKFLGLRASEREQWEED